MNRRDLLKLAPFAVITPAIAAETLEDLSPSTMLTMNLDDFKEGDVLIHKEVWFKCMGLTLRNHARWCEFKPREDLPPVFGALYMIKEYEPGHIPGAIWRPSENSVAWRCITVFTSSKSLLRML